MTSPYLLQELVSERQTHPQPDGLMVAVHKLDRARFLIHLNLARPEQGLSQLPSRAIISIQDCCILGRQIGFSTPGHQVKATCLQGCVEGLEAVACPQLGNGQLHEDQAYSKQKGTRIGGCASMTDMHRRVLLL